MGAATDVEIVNLALRKIGQKAITDLDDTTDTTAVKVNDVYAPLRRKLLRTHFWNFATVPAILGHVVDSSKTITGATATNPVVITSAGHGFSDDDVVSIVNVVGMVELNGKKFTVDEATGSTFELQGIDGTDFTAYASAGTVGVVSVVSVAIGFINRYGLPSDYLKMKEVLGDPVGFNPIRPIPSRVKPATSGIIYRIESNGTDKELVTDENEMSIKYLASVTDPTKFDDTFVDLFAWLLASDLAYTITQSKSMAVEMKAEYKRELAMAKGLNAQEGGTPNPIRQDDVVNARSAF